MNVYQDLGYQVHETPIANRVLSEGNERGLSDYDQLLKYLEKVRVEAVQFHIFGNEEAGARLRTALIKSEMYSKSLRNETLKRGSGGRSR